MSLQIFNTLTAKKEEFKPQNPPEVKMYTCGPTVYDFAHIGNFRTYVFQDLLVRYLGFKGFKVKRVMNITDVDDKTIAGAQRTKTTLEEFTRKYTDEFHQDLKTLNILPPTEELYATKMIPEMVRMIEQLIKKEHAYTKDGSVYFRIASFPRYGALSKKDLEGNIVGARVDQDEYEKEVGSDFALWKKAKEGDPSWDSPWGKGRPGWHIECSAMSLQAFHHSTLDIHTGGEDLIFPHHENEIAQSECSTGKKFVVYWVHAKHLLVDGEKMSKSKGNFYTLRDLLAKGFPPNAIRYLLLSTHYRKQLNFTFDGIQMAQESLKRIRDFWYDTKKYKPNTEKAHNLVLSEIEKAENKFDLAMDDDLHISEALASVFELINNVYALAPELDRSKGFDDFFKFEKFFQKISKILGISLDPEIPAEIEELAKQRQIARESRNFKLADELREKIKLRGYIVEDDAGGMKVKKIL